MTLAELINSDPGNAGRSDAEVLAWLNESVTAFVDVSWLDLSMWVAEHNLRPALITATTTGTDAAKTAAQHILDCIQAGQSLHARDERVRSVISRALAAGTAKTALLTMATTSVPRWQAAGVGEPTLGHIEALRWPAWQ